VPESSITDPNLRIDRREARIAVRPSPLRRKTDPENFLAPVKITLALIECSI
jgi:hypothetical protein